MTQLLKMNLISTSALLWFILVLYNFSRVYGNSEGDALYAFKKQLKDPYNVLENWDPTLINPCTWLCITCDPGNRVIRVDIRNTNLTGQLVPQLGQLMNLRHLEIAGNNITGKIPEELGNLRNLVSLDLHMNRLEGCIPRTLGNLQKLQYLRLHHNTLTGTIPYSLTAITTLQVLDLSYNHLRGHVPANGSFAKFSPRSFSNNPRLIYTVHVPPPPAPAPAPAPLIQKSPSGDE